jgi:flagellar biosynthesis/type III secretory pathway M-ring protein FliF/YscJ
MTEQRQKRGTFAGLIIVLLFAVLVALLVWQRQSIPTVEDVRKEERLKILADLNAENQKILTQYRWIDKSKGIVGIPIDRAMNLVLADLKANKPHAAGPIATPAPAATPAPNAAQPAASPAAPAAPQGAKP